MTESTLWDLANTTSALQAGIIALVGYLGRSTFRLADRLARIEEQVEETKDRIREIDKRCFQAFSRVGHSGVPE